MIQTLSAFRPGTYYLMAHSTVSAEPYTRARCLQLAITQHRRAWLVAYCKFGPALVLVFAHDWNYRAITYEVARNLAYSYLKELNCGNHNGS